MADRVVLLRSGRLEDAGTLDQLLDRSEEIRAQRGRDASVAHPLPDG